MPLRMQNWDCGRVKPLLPGLPDGELTPDVRRAVEAHLEGCESCRSEAGGFRALGRTLRAVPPPQEELPGGSQAVEWILRQEATRTRPWWSALEPVLRPGPAIGLAMATLLIVMVTRLELGTASRPQPVTSAAAPEALPALIVVDDEESGRQVLLAPHASAADGAGATATP